MKHLKIFENFSEAEYIFTPDENLMKMIQDWNQTWGKGADDHEGHITSLTGDRYNVTYFPFTGNKETQEKEKTILDVAVKGGYKPKKQMSNPHSAQDWNDFVQAIAPTMKGVK